jgi:D-alanyl-lipoteichoic acid acyltransferase DltB (MBOAT superfamily)
LSKQYQIQWGGWNRHLIIYITYTGNSLIHHDVLVWEKCIKILEIENS